MRRHPAKPPQAADQTALRNLVAKRRTDLDTIRAETAEQCALALERRIATFEGAGAHVRTANETLAQAARIIRAMYPPPETSP